MSHGMAFSSAVVVICDRCDARELRGVQVAVAQGWRISQRGPAYCRDCLRRMQIESGRG